MARRQQRQKAAIYDYDGHSIDENGELLLGYYWQLLDNLTERPITEQMGPYTSFHECFAALDRAYQHNDY